MAHAPRLAKTKSSTIRGGKHTLIEVLLHWPPMRNLHPNLRQHAESISVNRLHLSLGKELGQPHRLSSVASCNPLNEPVAVTQRHDRGGQS
jgi:hypothetical protein